MASGDLKGDECIVMLLQAGGANAIGDVVHFESDGYFDLVTTGDTGKFGVALDAATAEADYIRVCVWGRVEVKATAAAIKKGALVVAGTTGFVVDAGSITETTVYATIVGTAMSAFDSGGQGVIWVGLVD